MSDQQPLFDMERQAFQGGDKVVVQTIWGDEQGVVARVVPDTYYYSLLEVTLERGDTITIGSNRVRKTS